MLCVRKHVFECYDYMGKGCSDEFWWSEYLMEGGRRRSALALAMRTRLPNAMMPISDLRRLTSSSRSSLPEIPYSGGRHKVPYTWQGKKKKLLMNLSHTSWSNLLLVNHSTASSNSILSGVFSLIMKEKLLMPVVVVAFV